MNQLYISGIIVSGRVLSANHFIGKGYEFDAQIACVLGGVYLFGGKGTVGGAIFGAFVLALIQNSMTILGVRPYFQLIIRGMIFNQRAMTIYARMDHRIKRVFQNGVKLMGYLLAGLKMKL